MNRSSQTACRSRETCYGIGYFAVCPAGVEGKPLSAGHDGIEPKGALESITVDVLGLPVSLDAYAAILATLGVGGYRDESLGLAGSVDYGDDHFTCFQFDYDWRRDNVESAARLGRFIEAKKAYVSAEMAKRYGVKNAEVKFDIVAHSMGGLVARSSALLDERLAGRWTPTLRSPIAWRHVTFLFTGHLGMTRDPAFSDNVLYQLLEAPR